MTRAVIALLASGLAFGCDRQTTVAPDAAAADSAAVVLPGPPTPDAPTIDALRAAHDVGVSEGASCAIDGDCASPLRCLDAQCLFPPAMTGTFPAGAPTVTFTGARRPATTYRLEVADDPREQQRGLMHRRSMVGDTGMVFVFPRDEPRSFWMRNTLISLDMVFVRSDHVIDSIVERAEPQTDAPRRSVGDARFVVELNAGEAARMGLLPGSRAEITGLQE